jgi:predicted ribosomally synthesized peptide with SipW-like signal peptide
MINKKIVLSLLTLGMLVCVASAGTWAYFQDTITSTNNGVTTATIIMDVDTHKSATSATFTGTVVGNALPGTSGAVVTNTIKNEGSVPVDVYVKLVDVNVATKFGTDMSILVNGGAMTFGANPTRIGQNIPANGGTVTSAVTYNYADNGLQNAQEGQTASFNIIYYMVPTGTAVHP